MSFIFVSSNLPTYIFCSLLEKGWNYLGENSDQLVLFFFRGYALWFMDQTQSTRNSCTYTRAHHIPTSRRPCPNRAFHKLNWINRWGLFRAPVPDGGPRQPPTVPIRWRHGPRESNVRDYPSTKGQIVWSEDSAPSSSKPHFIIFRPLCRTEPLHVTPFRADRIIAHYQSIHSHSPQSVTQHYVVAYRRLVCYCRPYLSLV